MILFGNLIITYNILKINKKIIDIYGNLVYDRHDIIIRSSRVNRHDDTAATCKLL